MEMEVNQQSDPTDIEKNKAMAILAYIIFLIPLLAAKGSKFAMYHVNQGLILFLAAVVINILGAITPIIGWFFILTLGNLAIFVLVVMGIINAAQAQTKPLPIIGKFKVIK